MQLERFKALQRAFQALSARLKEAQELSERQAVLKQVQRLLAEMDELIRTSQADLQARIEAARHQLNRKV